METYDAKLAGSKTVALAHVSYDRKDAAAEKWALEAKMNWPIVLGSNRKESEMSQFSKSDYIPEYRLVDASGEMVPLKEGETAIEKAVELAGLEKVEAAE